MEPKRSEWPVFAGLILLAIGVLLLVWSNSRAANGVVVTPDRGRGEPDFGVQSTEAARLFDLIANLATSYAPTRTPTPTPTQPTRTPRPTWDAEASTPGGKYLIPPLPPPTDIAGPTRTPIYCDRITPDTTYQECAAR